MTGRALVTGASGFLGRHLTTALRRRSIATVALARAGSGEAATDERVTVANETDPVALAAALSEVKPDWIFHLAGRPTAASLPELYRANTLFGASLLQAARTLPGLPVVLLAGSAAEYGTAMADQERRSEETPCQPTTPYGITKLAQTLHGLAEPDRVVVARLFNPVGAGMPDHLALGHFAGQIARMGPAGGTLVTGLLSIERDFVDVDGVVDALIALVEAPPAEPTIVNVCSGVPTSLRDLVDGLVAASGKAIVVEERTDRGSATTKGLSHFVGDPARLASRGLAVRPPDPERLGRALLNLLL